MRLQTVSLTGRRFIIQFGEILQEFGQVIPWLEGLGELRFVTHPTVFRDRFLQRMKQDESGITPYQFVEDDQAGVFVGGVLHFKDSPECFRDHRNLEVIERLTATGNSFVSCLQVRRPFRRHGHGLIIMTRGIRTMVREHGPVWGVISDPHLIPWYEAMGAIIESPIENKDNLWIGVFAQ